MPVCMYVTIMKIRKVILAIMTITKVLVMKIAEATTQRCSLKKGVLKICSKFT